MGFWWEELEEQAGDDRGPGEGVECCGETSEVVCFHGSCDSRNCDIEGELLWQGDVYRYVPNNSLYRSLE